MVRRAASIKAITELGVLSPTRAYFLKNSSSIDDLIRKGRILAFQQDISGRKLKKAESELVSYLREAGFIHPSEDLILGFNVGRLYRRVYDSFRDCFVTEIQDITNEWYEHFVALSLADIQSIKSVLSSNLSVQRYQVLILRYGLTERGAKSFAEIGKEFGWSQNRAMNVEEDAIDRLKHLSCQTGREGKFLPPIFEAPGWIKEAIYKIEGDIDALHLDPIFEKERKLYLELDELHKDPAFRKERRLYGDLKKYTEIAPFRIREDHDRTADELPIKDLGLSGYIVRSLSCAGIHTVQDLLDLRIDLKTIPGIGQGAIEALTEKMHAFGYIDWPKSDSQE
ncbi:hypothetical protein J5491_00160 [Candidatus Saccharibacteria bacterium]|nr:hypothetical protein [Candidatus Saccharibacteria bacterium]